MKRCAVFVVLATAVALAQAAPAPEGITIKLKTNGEGDSVQVAHTETQKVKFNYVDPDGKMLVNMDEETMTVLEYKETILKRAGEKPATKLEREYTKADKKKGDNTEALGLSGKTVVIEKKDDKYTFVFKNGGEVTGLAAETLTKEFANTQDGFAKLERVLLPKEAVKIGDQWKLDAAAVLKEFDKEDAAEMDLTKTTGTGKLLKVYTKDGKRFGEMQFKMEAVVKSVGPGAAAIKFPDGAKYIVELSLDVCIDGTADVGTLKTKMGFNGTGTFANMPGSNLTMDIRSEGVYTQKESVKK